jgi:hypothetical protein
MPHYIALIHKDSDSCYGVSFPDVPGIFTAGDTIDEAMLQARRGPRIRRTGLARAFPPPRTIDQLRADSEFQQDAVDAVIAAVPFHAKAEAAE